MGSLELLAEVAGALCVFEQVDMCDDLVFRQHQQGKATSLQ